MNWTPLSMLVALIALGIDDGWRSCRRGALLVFAFGHCDTLDGPVVSLAQRASSRATSTSCALGAESDEAEIREASAQARRCVGSAEKRRSSPTVISSKRWAVHRAGEGAPYTGLKPAGRDLGPAIPATDLLTERSKGARSAKHAIRKGLHEHFHAASVPWSSRSTTSRQAGNTSRRMCRTSTSSRGYGWPPLRPRTVTTRKRAEAEHAEHHR